jgi:uncharacterized protein (DUF488 family)
MTSIPESDQRLISELQALLDQLAELKRGLYTRRPGCTCDEKHLCALHAAVYNHLSEASDDLARAINQAQAEG